MNYRILGKTGLKVSEVGYGTWQFANDDECWVGATREESERSLLTAIDQGVNFIDTARVYGDGLSEKRIGEIIKQRPNSDLVIASKIYPLNFQWPARPGTDIQNVFPKSHIIELVESSLKTLDIEALDVMFFHVWLDEWVEQDEWKETIRKLTQEWKVKHRGISTNNHESTNCIKACDTGLISVIQTIFNVFFQEPVGSLFPYVKENNIGLVARVPLDEGGLSGNINAQSVFPEWDFRNSYFTAENLIELDRRVKALQQVVWESNEVESLAELALRYILSFEEVSSVIPGMRKLKHVEENIRVAGKGGLSAGLLEELKRHEWNRNFYARGSWED